MLTYLAHPIQGVSKTIALIAGAYINAMFRSERQCDQPRVLYP